MGRHITVTSNPGRMVTHLTAEFLGRRFESWSVDAGGGAVPWFKPPTKKSTAACITIRPLPVLRLTAGLSN